MASNDKSKDAGKSEKAAKPAEKKIGDKKPERKASKPAGAATGAAKPAEKSAGGEGAGATEAHAGQGHGHGRGGREGGGGGHGREGGGGRRRRDGENRDRDNREGEELIEKLVSINRVSSVVKGGKRFNFAALVVVGDGKGRVGHGTGKAREVPDAIRKATASARARLLRVPLRDGRTLHHDSRGHFGSGKVVVRTAPSGTGIIAGGPMRAVFEALGVHDVVAKSVGSSNPHNMVRATFDALANVSSPRLVAARRGKKVSDILGRRPDEVGEGKEAAPKGAAA
ncbi:MAG: 30S ribosomal protein S5 [Alphaproteobacteria bacterium]|nr:MAG: 30S ribosomal protein S5 [Alphaproteobacteria bacterium]